MVQTLSNLQIFISESACDHFIEASLYIDAVEAAIAARKYSKANEILENISDESALTYYLQIARSYQNGKKFDQAEQFYIKSGRFQVCFCSFDIKIHKLFAASGENAYSQSKF